MYILYYDAGGVEIFVGELLTNQALTIDEMLDLVSFDEISFKSEHRFDEIDYNEFYVRYVDEVY